MADTKKHYVDKSRWESEAWREKPLFYRAILVLLIDLSDHRGYLKVNLEYIKYLLNTKSDLNWESFLEKMSEFVVVLSKNEIWLPSVIQDNYKELKLACNTHKSVIAFLKKYNLEKHPAVKMEKIAASAKLSNEKGRLFKETKTLARLRKPSKKFLDSLPRDPALIDEKMLARLYTLVYVRKNDDDPNEAFPRREWCEAYHRISEFTWDFEGFWDRYTNTYKWVREGKLIQDWRARMNTWNTNAKKWSERQDKPSQQPALKIAVDPDEAVKRMHELTLEDKKRRMEQEIPRSPGLIKELARAR